MSCCGRYGRTIVITRWYRYLEPTRRISGDTPLARHDETTYADSAGWLMPTMVSTLTGSSSLTFGVYISVEARLLTANCSCAHETTRVTRVPVFSSACSSGSQHAHFRPLRFCIALDSAESVLRFINARSSTRAVQQRDNYTIGGAVTWCPFNMALPLPVSFRRS
jgi:hypothetical protein